MPERSPTLETVLRLVFRQRQEDMHTSMPGRIISYDPATQKADVQPMLQRRQPMSEGGEDLVQDLPVLPDVPIVFPRGGNFFISFPIAVGDRVLLIFNERSIDRYTTGSGGPNPSDPGDHRMHNLSDAVAIPGFYPFSGSIDDAHADNLVIGKDGGVQIHLTGALVNLGAAAPASFVALAQKVDQELAAVKADLDALKLLLLTHAHPGVSSGNSATQPSPAFAAYTPHVPASTAATKVKAE